MKLICGSQKQAAGVKYLKHEKFYKLFEKESNYAELRCFKFQGKFKFQENSNFIIKHLGVCRNKKSTTKAEWRDLRGAGHQRWLESCKRYKE